MANIESELIGKLLAEHRTMPLDAGTPSPDGARRLRSVTADDLFAPSRVKDPDMARACLAALWLRFDELDKSHQISQGIHTPEGSFWHAIMHRREGDFSNAKYWFRRVGRHPALSGDPFDFVDRVEAHLVRGVGSREELVAEQHLEWERLFDYCATRAVGAD